MVVEAQGAPVAAPVHAAVEIFRPGRRQVPPAVFLESLRVDVVGPIAVVATALDVGDRPAVGTALDFHRVPQMAEPILHLHDHRATERIQPVQGIRAAEQAEACDRIHGHQIPVHRIAQGFVEPHAVLVDRQTHGQAEQRRCGIASIVEVGLQRIALGRVEMHTAEAPAEKIRDFRAAARRKFFGYGGLDDAGIFARACALGANRCGAQYRYRLDILRRDRRKWNVQHCQHGRCKQRRQGRFDPARHI